ncbi:hypothetical protein [Streptomyces sp. SID13031]|uniref:hypothetical protein n=1 Tax=Streptomyces sp. SID13031 TaxID=2706046 RepID=UPI0013C5962A|nr:hypothetical protein [Streptomyces sp. SID13031]NEA30155.1 hypothetical protein [Streptomyces sp. SID13031]
MPSDLQRVARGLVECLNEVPAVVAHLQRTAERCRENAALAIAASQGQATVAAQQLDAAARACEQAAHYLSMAPPKAKTWAERLVGAPRSGDRPDAQSADRNRATGGSSDIAERDLFGRVTRTSLPFKPLEDAEGKEPPLITVARKAFEKLRKQQEKAEEEREQPEELEVEIVVAETGEIEVVDQKPPEDRDYEIKVELDTAATDLLKSMQEHGQQTWTAATILIAPTRVTATFTYPDEPPPTPAPVIIDVELPEPSAPAADSQPPPQPEVPEIDVALDDLPDFEPAFHRRALGDDFAPSVHDPHRGFSAKELRIAERLVGEGWRIDARLVDNGSDDPNPDGMTRKDRSDRGSVIEFKTLETARVETVKRNILKAGRQVRSVDGEVVVDGRNVKLGEADAREAYRAAARQPGATVARVVHLILGDGRMITYAKEN